MSGVAFVQNPHSSNTQATIIANSAHLDFGDPVVLTSGFLTRASAGSRIAGNYVGASVDATADNQTVLKAKGSWQPADDDSVFEITSNLTGTQAHIGQYAKITLSTNAVLLDVNGALSTTVGQYWIVDYAQDNLATGTLFRVKCATPQHFAYTPST
jgi:hypothetical protein